MVEYLKAWERADARDEAYVRGGLAVVDAAAAAGDVKKDAWERRAAAGHRARCRTLGLSSEWSQSESSSSSSSSSSSEDDE